MKPIVYPPTLVMTKTNLQDWLNATKKNFEGVREFTSLEVYAIASLVLGHPREWLITHGDTILDNNHLDYLQNKIRRLMQGEPLPYIIGRQSFYGLDFFVTPDVLIPRPETELLVEEAINWLTSHSVSRTLIDVGTGSGIIPITLADQFPDLKATGIDISSKALDVANANIKYFNLEQNISILQNDLLNGLSLKADLITANLPYIPHERLKSLEVTKFEPSIALDGGSGGLELILRLLSQLPSSLNQGGLALLEIDISQAQVVIKEATKFIPSAKITVLNDLANLPRLLKIQN
jgi:release factor glutamine methyltransferase